MEIIFNIRPILPVAFLFWILLLLGKESLVYQCIRGFISIITIMHVVTKKNK
jgi:hypothetical protein